MTRMHALQATLEAAQEAMMEQAEEMRKVTAERDALRLRLIGNSQTLTRSSTAAGDSGLISASYDSDTRPARPLTGKPHVAAL